MAFREPIDQTMLSSRMLSDLVFRRFYVNHMLTYLASDIDSVPGNSSEQPFSLLTLCFPKPS